MVERCWFCGRIEGEIPNLTALKERLGVEKSFDHIVSPIDAYVCLACVSLMRKAIGDLSAEQQEKISRWIKE